MITYKLHILRTGKTSTGQWKHYVGQSNPHLCEEGIAELEQLRRTFEYPRAEMVYTSPLSRCVETAELLYPNTYTVEAEGLMDMNLGDFEGKTLEELKDDAAFTAWLKDSNANPPPGGEETFDFTRRIVSAVDGIFRTMMEEKQTNVALITHGGVIMTLLASIGLPKQPIHQWAADNGKGYTLLMTPQMWMRDRAVEIYSHQPVSLDGNRDGMYFDI